MKKISLVTLTLILFFSISTLARNQRGPSTPQERETAVKVARLLESDPFNKDAKKMREWFFKWIADVNLV